MDRGVDGYVAQWTTEGHTTTCLWRDADFWTRLGLHLGARPRDKAVPVRLAPGARLTWDGDPAYSIQRFRISVEPDGSFKANPA